MIDAKKIISELEAEMNQTLPFWEKKGMHSEFRLGPMVSRIIERFVDEMNALEKRLTPSIQIPEPSIHISFNPK